MLPPAAFVHQPIPLVQMEGGAVEQQQGGAIVSPFIDVPSVFSVQLEGSNLYRAANPVTQMLRNTWIAEVMRRSILISDQHLPLEQARSLLTQHPEWIIIKHHNCMIRPAELAEALNNLDGEEQSIDLLAIPADRKYLESISIKANMQDALNLMHEHNIDWLLVHHDKHLTQPTGVVNRDNIQQYYEYKATQ